MREVIDKYIVWILPIPFIGAVFLNLFAWVLHIDLNDSIRLLFVIGLQGIVALLLVGYVVDIFIKQKEYRKFISSVVMILICFVAIYLWALYSCIYKLEVFKKLVVNSCYLISALCALTIIYTKKEIKCFVVACKCYALAVVPIFVFYCIRFYIVREYGIINIGKICYMSIAYFLLNFCAIFFADGLISKTKQAFWSDYALLSLFVFSIALSQTRGTILCLLFLTIVACIYSIVKRINIKKIALYAITTWVIVLFTILYYPSSINSRVKVAEISETINIAEQEATSAEQEATIKQKKGLSKFIADRDRCYSVISRFKSCRTANSITEDEIISFYLDGDLTTNFENGNISQEDYDFLYDMYHKLNHTGNYGRLYLWAYAVDEISRAPLFGHGPMYYQDKYGTYPHNIFLEVACDFGIICMLLFIILGLYVVCKLLLLSYKEQNIMLFVIYVLAFMPQTLVSGSFYDCQIFWECGFGLVLLIFSNPKNVVKVENCES